MGNNELKSRESRINANSVAFRVGKNDGKKPATSCHCTELMGMWMVFAPSGTTVDSMFSLDTAKENRVGEIPITIDHQRCIVQGEGC